MNLLLASALLLIAFAVCLAGCLLLALSQVRNWRRVTGDSKAIAPKSSTAGWLFVLLSLVPCVLRDGASFAALLWPLIFAASAMTAALLLTYRAAWLKPVARMLSRTS